MEKFEPGDFVEVLDEQVSGKVVRVEKGKISVETPEGFEFIFSENELVKISGQTEIAIDRSALEMARREKQIKPKTRPRKTKPKERNAPAMEVDLHIEELTGSIKNMSNFEMLNIQLDTAKRKLDFAFQKRIQKVVFIHGVGQGVLKAELETLLRRYDNLKFYDADQKKYGFGATEVYIFQIS